jgi:hypothetical protein
MRIHEFEAQVVRQCLRARITARDIDKEFGAYCKVNWGKLSHKLCSIYEVGSMSVSVTACTSGPISWKESTAEVGIETTFEISPKKRGSCKYWQRKRWSSINSMGCSLSSTVTYNYKNHITYKPPSNLHCKLLGWDVRCICYNPENFSPNPDPDRGDVF